MRWYRVFGTAEPQPSPAALEQRLIALGVVGPVRVRGDDNGWTAAEFSLPGGGSPLSIECFLAGEPGIRSELNTWAAWLETCDYSPNHATLMERVIQTKQLYTLRQPIDHADEARLEDVCTGISRFLAGATGGVYQQDGVGFFAPDGELLLREY